MKQTTQTCRIADIAEKVAMGPFGSNIKVETFVPAGVPIISGAHLKGFYVEEDSFNYITEEHAQRLKNSIVYPGDIIFTHAGTVGQAAMIPYNCHYPYYMISQRQFYLRCDKKKVLPEYLVYYFHSHEGQGKLLSNVSQVGVPSIAQPSSFLKKIEVPLPSLETQRRIVGILDSFTKKIEVNNKINRNLEEQAKAIFKSWFVDFEPFQNGESVDSELGRIPKGWNISSLSNIASFLNGLAMQKYRPEEDDAGLPVLKIKELHQGYCDTNSDRCSLEIPEQYIIRDGDVVFSWSGTLLVDFWCGGECGLNQHLFKVTSEKYDKWFYFLWISHHLAEFSAIAEGKATTMGHIKREHLDQAKVLLPSASDYNRLSSVLKPLYDQIVLNKIESKKLALLRDTLLPKLMSGETFLKEETYGRE
jgi:type I restriction enzyme S subunit